MIYAFTVPGRPRGKDRPRFAVRGKGDKRFVQTYTTKKTMAFEERVAQAAAPAMGNVVLDGAISVVVVLVFPRTNALKKIVKKTGLPKHQAVGLPHTVKPDADNCCKAVLDGLKVWLKDQQVWHLHVQKFYSDMVLEDGEWREKLPCTHVSLKTTPRL